MASTLGVYATPEDQAAVSDQIDMDSAQGQFMQAVQPHIATLNAQAHAQEIDQAKAQFDAGLRQRMQDDQDQQNELADARGQFEHGLRQALIPMPGRPTPILATPPATPPQPSASTTAAGGVGQGAGSRTVPSSGGSSTPAAVGSSAQVGYSGGADTLDWLNQQSHAGLTKGWQSFGEATPWDNNQKGQSVGVGAGTAVPLPAGQVSAVTPWGYGDFAVSVRRPDGTTVTVGHVERPDLAVGQSLQGGETVTGRGYASPISSGPHIDVRVQDQNGAYIDPMRYIGSAASRGYRGDHGGTPPATNQQGDQTFGQQTGGGLQDYLDQAAPMPPVQGQPAGDNGPSPSDQQTPIAQYNEAAPGGLDTFRQVTKMGSGDYRAEPTAQPSDAQQATYNDQQAATQGFTAPADGTPLLAAGDGSAPSAGPESPAPSPQAQSGAVATDGTTPSPDQSTVGTAASPAPLASPASDSAATIPAPSQSTPGDTAQALKDASQSYLADPSAANQAAFQAASRADNVARGLNQDGSMPAPAATPATPASPAPGGIDLGQVSSLFHQLGDALGPKLRAVEQSAPVQAAEAVMGPSGGAVLPGQPPDLTKTSLEPELSSGYKQAEQAAQGIAGAMTVGIPMGGAKAVQPVAEAASQVVDSAVPAMAGAAQGQAPKAIEDLNNLIGSFGQAIDKAASPAEATREVAQADTAATALGKGLADEYARFKLTPAENQAVADIIEGNSTVGAGPLRQEVAQTADALKATNDATWQMANRAGVLDGMTENYFTHLVRVPADDLKQMGGSIAPSALSDWSRFAAGRARDEAGNVLNPTVRDLKDYLAEAHPTWQVVDDVPTVVAAHVRSLVTAANHAQLADYLKAAVDEAGQPLLSAVKRAGDVQLNVPQSLSKWLYRGQAPEEGNVAVASRGGVLGAGDGPAVMVQQPLQWARPEAAQFIDRYVAPDLMADMLTKNAAARNFATSVGTVYDKLNRGLVALRLMNPIIHGENMVSETLAQYARPSQLAGIGGDWQNAQRILSDPVAMTKLLQEAPLNLSSVRQFAAKLAQATGRIGPESDVPIVTGSKNVVGKLAEADHNFLFNTVGQRLQLTSYFGALRDGMDPLTAAKYANAKFGQFSRQDFEPWARWIGQHVAFASQWTNGGLVQYGSLLKGAGYGGYTSGMAANQAKYLQGALRGDLLRGAALLGGVGGMTYWATTGKKPWEDPQGYLGYLGHSPMLRREEDVFKLATDPKGTIGNKLAPMLSAAGTFGENLHSMGFLKGLGRSLAEVPYEAAVPGAQMPTSKPQQQSDNGILGALIGLRNIPQPKGGSGSTKPAAPAPPHIGR